jgi:hypothetical protein
MRFLCAILCLFLATAGRAAEWRNDLFGCSANLPDTAGWQPIEAANSPSVTVLVAMQHPQKQAVFGINILHELPSANLRDPATVTAIEQSLRNLGYQFFGRATVNVAGREWMQFPVRGSNPPTSGLIRYTSANNHVYVVSLLRGGGQEAAQDPELQAAAASVRITQGQAAPVAVAPVSPPIAATPTAPASPSSPPATATPATEPASAAESTDVVKIGPVTITRQQFRLGLYGIGGLVVLLILLKIISGGSSSTPPNQPRR